MTEQRVGDIATARVHACSTDTSVQQATEMMRQHAVGDVLVVDGEGALVGILTDRDVVVRTVSAGRPPEQVAVEDGCSPARVTVAADRAPQEALQVMRGKAIRRLPVTDGDRPVAFVSLGDLAQDRDRGSPLSAISAAPPNT
jgi:CBS domain-containing protein